MHHNSTQSRATTSKQGSALIIAMIFTTVLAVIAIPSYLNLSNQTLKQSNRVFYNTAAINLAESGVEYAVQAIMLQSENNYNWSNWTLTGGSALKTLDEIVFTGDIKATTKISIYNYSSDAPEVVVKSTINMPFGPAIEKYMYASISASSTQGLFAYGMLTKDFIKASGGVAFDSWTSDPDNDPDTPYIPYSSRVATDKVAIATASTSAGAITLGSSDVYGTAAVGSADYSGLSVGWGGQVGPKDMSEWDPSDTDELWKKDGWLVSTQTGALSTGFTAAFEDITAPSLTPTDYRLDYKLPYTDRREVSNKWSTWYQNVYVDEETLGAPNTLTILNLDELEVKAGATLRLEGDIIINLPNENKTTLKVIEGGAIEMADDATVTVYLAGDMAITGAGLFSEVSPQQLQIWGTATGTQNFDFLNNGQFSGIIYAPNAEVKVTGNSDIYGSVIAKSIELTGSGSFRYDQSLANYTGGTTSAGPTRVDYVEELVGIERDPYIDDMAF
ncbi:hypothetical protein SH580_10875 [Coraliomargarita algicola]|uniref:DUF7305 domain-containing protein n=1 Tax=Coraliomargarita algicola TaxID=3092156 RepID=A0ABZ0RFZ7_9BACT|nr:collagen-binding domain-containing protein [Coraliomargarita sp. J2-16]WPJ93940.1 hypothetical protein SH580_10875 [Coraliomargarita sp. J2-16]